MEAEERALCVLACVCVCLRVHPLLQVCVHTHKLAVRLEGLRITVINTPLHRPPSVLKPTRASVWIRAAGTSPR